METIAILGIGKLGICFALNLERSGYAVLGVDISPAYIETVNRKTLRSFEPRVEEYLLESRNFEATTSLHEALESEAEMFFVCVATPSTPGGGYDHYQIDGIADQLEKFGPNPNPRHLVIVATTMPGYCDELSARLSPLNWRVSYNPEFIAQGNIIHDQQYPDQVLIGEADEIAGQKIEAVYRQMCKNEPVFCRMRRLSAEICKIATNCFLTTKISFANSIGDLATLVGAEPDKILQAIGSDSRIGGKYLGYGYGFGGPCFPRDNRALGKFARDAGYDLLISEATDEVNRRHLDFQFQLWMDNFKEDQPILFDYVTYKKDSILLIESQQLALAEKLARAGRQVMIREREVVVEELRARYGELFQYLILEEKV
ncbi:MAG: UDP-glucose/GDP-mannose dehydrogenase family protein [Bacteroidia bacterium]|nr:UDP-glucose/GDP-mannose dehydrogenase family protein [Bacteroidia bacterium]